MCDHSDDRRPPSATSEERSWSAHQMSPPLPPALVRSSAVHRATRVPRVLPLVRGPSGWLILIIVVASAIAAAVREVISASLGGLSYGNALANAASVVILAVGIFAALNQVEIAPAIVNGLFYALLAIIAGSAIVAIGGSGIVPLRSYWERALQRLDEESSRIREESQGSSDTIRSRAEQRRLQADPDPADRSPGGATAVHPDRARRPRDRGTWDEPGAYGGDEMTRPRR